MNVADVIKETKDLFVSKGLSAREVLFVLRELETDALLGVFIELSEGEKNG
jgi:hypothetical protein